MEPKELITQALSDIEAATVLIGDAQPTDNAAIYAAIAQAKALTAIALLLSGLIGESKNGRKHIRTYDQSPSSVI